MRFTPIVLLVVLVCGCGREGIHVTVAPAAGTTDVPFDIRASGLRDHERVIITASGRSESGVVWRARQTASADARGKLVMRDQYLLARLRSQDSSSVGPWPQKITVTIHSHGRSASASAHRASPSPDSLKRDDVRLSKQGFFGEWIRPRAAARHTSILLLGGSDGGLPSYVDTIATTLAGDGYPVLALAYFNAPGLPTGLARIPLEYFRRALEWMRTQPEVDASRVVTFGVSRGGELSLIVASTYPRLVHAAVGYVPVQWVVGGYPDASQPAWLYHGKPYQGDGGRIPVERIAGPVFVVGGADDQLWPSARGVRAIANRLRAHGRNEVTALVYRGAGHLVGSAVPIQIDAGSTGIAPEFGGSSRIDELAREDSWPKLLRFLAKL
jgi:dienelactone hydrolase